MFYLAAALPLLLTTLCEYLGTEETNRWWNVCSFLFDGGWRSLLCYILHLSQDCSQLTLAAGVFHYGAVIQAECGF